MSVDRDERIRQRAYEIWEREGRPHGRDEEHWRMAVDELIEELEHAKITQDVPAARVTETAKQPGASSVDAQPAKPVAGNNEPRPAPQADPLGLAQPKEETVPARRASAKPRGGQARKPANGARPTAPNRSR
jgi:Protein of unknown function (DUF2934)